MNRRLGTVIDFVRTMSLCMVPRRPAPPPGNLNHELRPHGADALLARLPADLEPGDLIAIPCRRPIALANLRRSSRHPERMDR